MRELLFLSLLLVLVIGCKSEQAADSAGDTSYLTGVNNQTIAEGRSALYVDVDLKTGGDTTEKGVDVVYGCYYDTTVDGRVANTLECTDLSGADFSSSYGVLSWAPDYSSDGVYEFKILAYDGTSNAHRIFTVTVTPTPRLPEIATIADTSAGKQLPMIPIDPSDANSGTDTDRDGVPLTYSCTYDKTVDDTVTATTSCSTLQGFDLNTSTGVINWTPTVTQSGAFEMKLTASNGDLTDDEIFVITVGPKYFKDIGVGDGFACGLAEDGIVYCWGDNGVNTASTVPAAIAEPEGGPFVSLTVGGKHACGLSSDGAIFCWGKNQYGQLGINNTIDQTIPAEFYPNNLNANTSMKSVVAGNNHTCGIATDGQVYCWGDDQFGQVGDGGSLIYEILGKKTSNATDMIALSSGDKRSCALAYNHTLYCWGETTSSVVTVSTSNLPTGAHLVSITSGGLHHCGLTANGRAYCWGSDTNGELGDGGTNTDKTAPVAVDMSALPTGGTFLSLALGTNHSCGIGSDYKLYCWGSDGGAISSTTPELFDSSSMGATAAFKKVAAGNNTTCATVYTGLTYCWGSDSSGQLGNGGSNTDTSTPTIVNVDNLNAVPGSFANVVARSNSTYATSNDGIGYSWGSGDYGRLGVDETNAQNRYSPTAVITTNLTSGASFINVGANIFTACRTATDGNIYCAGYDYYASLGRGTSSWTYEYLLEPVLTTNLNAGEIFTSVAMGQMHGCGLTNHGRILCWGYGYNGQTGGGISNEFPTPVEVDTTNLAAGSLFTSVVAGIEHTCATTSDGKAYCWGADHDGRIGNDLSNSSYVWIPTLVDTSGLTAGSLFVSLSAGDYTTCGITSDGKAYCWGSDNWGMLGNDLVQTNKYIPTLVDKTNIPATSGFMSQDGGTYNICSLTNQGLIYCTGYAGNGSLGNNTTSPSKFIPDPVVTSNLTPATRFISVSVGENHGCALASDGKTYCWGYGWYGQLAQGVDDLNQYSLPVLIDTSGM